MRKNRFKDLLSNNPKNGKNSPRTYKMHLSLPALPGTRNKLLLEWVYVKGPISRVKSLELNSSWWNFSELWLKLPPFFSMGVNSAQLQSQNYRVNICSAQKSRKESNKVQRNYARRNFTINFWLMKLTPVSVMCVEPCPNVALWLRLTMTCKKFSGYLRRRTSWSFSRIRRQIWVRSIRFRRPTTSSTFSGDARWTIRSTSARTLCRCVGRRRKTFLLCTWQPSLARALWSSA